MALLGTAWLQTIRTIKLQYHKELGSQVTHDPKGNLLVKDIFREMGLLLVSSFDSASPVIMENIELKLYDDKIIW